MSDSLADLTLQVLVEQDEEVVDEGKFNELLDREFGIGIDDLDEAVAVEGVSPVDGEPVGPIFLVTPHSAFLAGLLVGKRFAEQG